MKRMTITDEANTLYKAFQEQYSSIVISFDTVKRFVKTRFYQDEKGRKSTATMLDLMKDWALALQLEEGVEL